MFDIRTEGMMMI